MKLTGVSPADLRGPVVDGESVGQAQTLRDYHSPVAAVHAGTSDLGRIAVPVRPEDEAGHKNSSDHLQCEGNRKWFDGDGTYKRVYTSEFDTIYRPTRCHAVSQCKNQS